MRGLSPGFCHMLTALTSKHQIKCFKWLGNGNGKDVQAAFASPLLVASILCSPVVCAKHTVREEQNFFSLSNYSWARQLSASWSSCQMRAEDCSGWPLVNQESAPAIHFRLIHLFTDPCWAISATTSNRLREDCRVNGIKRTSESGCAKSDVSVWAT